MDLALVFFYIYNKFLLYSTQVCYRTLDIVLLFMYCYYKKQSNPSMCISTYICNHTGLIQLTKLHCYAWQCLPKYVQQTKTQALTFFLHLGITIPIHSQSSQYHMVVLIQNQTRSLNHCICAIKSLT